MRAKLLKAERMVQEALAAAGVREVDLPNRRKSDRAKVGVAIRLRRETTLSWKGIARRLAMGHWRSAANLVRDAKPKKATTSN